MQAKILSFKDNYRVAFKNTLAVGLFICLMALSSRIRFYMPFSPVPATLQTLVVFLSAIFLGRKSLYVQLGWLCLGLAGVPVFSSGSGFLYLFGPTGGYILGFLAAAMVLPPILDFKKGIAWYAVSFSLANLLIYFLGVAWLSVYLKMPLISAIGAGYLPFIYSDIFKISLASLIARLVKN